MKLTLRRCYSCKALGVGPRAVKLWPFENRLYCRSHYSDALSWDESRGNIALALQFEVANIEAIERKMRHVKARIPLKPGWEGFIWQECELAGWALQHDDRRTFVYYFSRAVWAWALKEDQDAVK